VTAPIWGGKSELHRAGRWVTPRRGNPTESATETHRQRPRRDRGAGKGEMARQELTSNWETGWLDKPRPEQDQIRGPNYPKVSRLWDKSKVLGRDPWVGRLTSMVTSGLDGWSPLRLGRGTELGLQVCSPQNFFRPSMWQTTGMSPKP
jgi:hypothetical protein